MIRMVRMMRKPGTSFALLLVTGCMSICLCGCGITEVRAAIGEDEAACIKRYGPITERGTVNRKADFTLHWDRKDRIITAAFVDGTCAMVTHAMKAGAGDLPAEDITAILNDNIPPDSGLTWKPRDPSAAATGPLSQSWTRSDDKATAVHMGELLIISTREYLARKLR